MYRQFVESRILARHTIHGHPTQLHVVLTDSEGNKEFLWMSIYDYVDWIEDPLIVNGKTAPFDPSVYNVFM